VSDAVTDALRDVLAADSSVRLAYLFGSAARGEQGQGSDLDVAVLAEGPLGLDSTARLAERLERAISFRHRVDVVDLRAASPVLAAEVVRDGIVLLQRDAELRFGFEIDAIRRFEDTRPLRRAQHELLREAARGAS
jgi:predicted nucleotidyltransferase